MIATPDRPSFAATRQRESALLEPRPLADLLAAYRGLIDTGPATEPRLRAALDHVLGNPGSLLRAQLAFHLLHSHGFEAPRARAVAVAIEYFHTASLVFDDMPAMDDADERRGAPCVHHRFDEATATLAALALINRAYALLWQVLGTLPGPARDAAAQLVGECLGAQGILSGQSRDLQFEASPRREHDVLAVAEGKTVTLIRLTLLLPALIAGAPADACATLEKLASCWGLAYQLMDDFKDILLTASESGKTAARDGGGHRPNLPAAIGMDAARARLASLLDEARSLVAGLQSHGTAWSILEGLQHVLDRERIRLQTRLAVAA